jgi:hypothetical protein
MHAKLGIKPAERPPASEERDPLAFCVEARLVNMWADVLGHSSQEANHILDFGRAFLQAPVEFLATLLHTLALLLSRYGRIAVSSLAIRILQSIDRWLKVAKVFGPALSMTLYTAMIGRWRIGLFLE